MKPTRSCLLPYVCLLTWTTLSSSHAATGFSIRATPGDGVIIEYAGAPVAEYVVNEANKPFLKNVIAPGGHEITRGFPMKSVSGEPTDHPQHRGIYFAHQNIGGADTWEEPSTYKPGKGKGAPTLGKIQHRKYAELQADAAKAVIVDLCDILDGTGRKVCEMAHRMTFSGGPEERIIDSDVRLTASGREVVVFDAKEAGFCIRIAGSMAVDAGKGGTIVNSNGDTNNTAWGKAASWCDYSGPVAGEVVGVAMLNHPSSFRYPTRWHVRSYGLFAANPFGQRSIDKSAPDGSITLRQGEDIVLSNRMILHRGNAAQAGIAVAFDAYAREPRPGGNSSPRVIGAGASSSPPSFTKVQTDANQPRIEVIKDQGPNAAEWALTPLDEAIPTDIRQNLTFLREDLLDEGKKAAKASPEAYKLASDYCDKILSALDQRDLARVNAGYASAQADAGKRISTQALDARRNHQMSWPQYAREESQRTALRENEADKADVKKQRLKVEWTSRAVQMRTYLDDLYRQLREAMR
jgi:hypothetical protein